MGKRIATQLAEEIDYKVESAVDNGLMYVPIEINDARRWLKWAKALDARMRLDGSPKSKQRKPKAKPAK